MRETSAQKEPGRGGHSRREVIAGATGALGAIAATTLISAAPAQAAQGQAVIEGADNTGATARTGVFTTNNSEWGILADPNTSGRGSLGVYGHGKDLGVLGEADASSTLGLGVFGTGAGNGAGVLGTGGLTGGFGVVGSGNGTGHGVRGVSNGNGGPGVSGLGNPGVRAELGVSGGNALEVFGPAAFSRSGVLTVAARHSSATKSGVALTAASLVLATIQGNVAGVTVQGVTRVVGAAGSFTVHLNKTVSASTSVAWFVVN